MGVVSKAGTGRVQRERERKKKSETYIGEKTKEILEKKDERRRKKKTISWKLK